MFGNKTRDEMITGLREHIMDNKNYFNLLNFKLNESMSRIEKLELQLKCQHPINSRNFIYTSMENFFTGYEECCICKRELEHFSSHIQLKKKELKNEQEKLKIHKQITKNLEQEIKDEN